MRKQTAEKLESCRGASLVFALLVVLLCALGGTAALKGASSSAGRYAYREADRQEALTLASAVELLRGNLAGRSFVAELTRVEIYRWWYEVETDAEGEPVLHRQESRAWKLLEPEYRFSARPEEEIPETEEATEPGLVETLLKDHVTARFLAEEVPASWFGAETQRPAGLERPPRPAGLTRDLIVRGEAALGEIFAPVSASFAMEEGSWDQTLLLSMEGPEGLQSRTTELQIPGRAVRSGETRTETDGDAFAGERRTFTTVRLRVDWRNGDAAVWRRPEGEMPP